MRKFTTNADIKDRQKFEVVKRTTRSEVRGIKLDENRKYEFGNNGSFYVDDPGVARDIHDQFGQGVGGSDDVLVVPVEKKAEAGHSRTFLVPRLPWHEEK